MFHISSSVSIIQIALHCKIKLPARSNVLFHSDFGLKVFFHSRCCQKSFFNESKLPQPFGPRIIPVSFWDFHFREHQLTLFLSFCDLVLTYESRSCVLAEFFIPLSAKLRLPCHGLIFFLLGDARRCNFIMSCSNYPYHLNPQRIKTFGLKLQF